MEWVPFVSILTADAESTQRGDEVSERAAWNRFDGIAIEREKCQLSIAQKGVVGYGADAVETHVQHLSTAIYIH